MRIKLFEQFSHIDAICTEYDIQNYTINPDGTVDVDGDVDFRTSSLDKFPINFGRVTGNFYCEYNSLTQLVGSPKFVGGNFGCSENSLTSLEGGPVEVGGSYFCHYNKLTSLVGSPHRVGGDFNCCDNLLSTLKGSPVEVDGYFACNGNSLETLVGAPNIVGGKFYCYRNKIISFDGLPDVQSLDCSGNPINHIYRMFDNHKEFMDSLDWDYFRGDQIIKSRFEEACKESGIELPDEPYFYKYI